MSYVNPDVIGEDIPFAGKHVIEKTRTFWVVEAARFAKSSPCTVCGDVKGTCEDCLEYSKETHMHGKINIGSGEDACAFR